MSRPFATERDARAASLWATHGREHGMSIESANLSDLAAELSGVQLGAYDKRIIDWLAGWEPSTVTVICGLIKRARAAGAAARHGGYDLASGDVAVVLDALDVAADYRRDTAEMCGDCDGQPDGGLCGTCEWRLTLADGYAALAERIREATQ
jgi:hypothetical protein